jgi:hypothetical protein
LKRYDLKITKTIVESVQARSYVEAVLAAEFSLSSGGDMTDAFAKAEPQIADAHALGECSSIAMKAPATPSEALALLQFALIEAKNVGLLATLEQDLERDCIDTFTKAVDTLSVQFQEFSDAVPGEKESPAPSGDSVEVWAMLHQEAAQREGWFLSECNGSSYGPWQIQKIDYPEDNVLPDGTLPPTLEDDEQAQQIVADGTGDHHAFAREHLKVHNPKEYERIMAMKASAMA